MGMDSTFIGAFVPLTCARMITKVHIERVVLLQVIRYIWMTNFTDSTPVNANKMQTATERNSSNARANVQNYDCFDAGGEIGER